MLIPARGKRNHKNHGVVLKLIITRRHTTPRVTSPWIANPFNSSFLLCAIVFILKLLCTFNFILQLYVLTYNLSIHFYVIFLFWGRDFISCGKTVYPAGLKPIFPSNSCCLFVVYLDNRWWMIVRNSQKFSPNVSAFLQVAFDCNNILGNKQPIIYY